MELQELTKKTKELLKIQQQNSKKEIELIKDLLKTSRKEFVGKKICILPRDRYNSFDFIDVIDIKKSNWGNDNHIAFKGVCYSITPQGYIEYYSKGLNHKYIGEMKNIVILSDEQWNAIVQFVAKDKELCDEHKQFLETVTNNKICDGERRVHRIV